MKSRSGHARWMVLLLVFAVVSSCTNRIDPPPVRTVKPSVTTTTMKADILHMDAPQGWVFQKKYRITFPFLDYRLFHDYDPTMYTGILIKRIDFSEIDSKHRMAVKNLQGLEEYRNDALQSVSERGFFNGAILPNRNFDGLWGVGYSGNAVEKGRKYAIQVWFICRRDGLWRFGIYGYPDSGDIPQELLAAMDTIKWE